MEYLHEDGEGYTDAKKLDEIIRLFKENLYRGGWLYGHGTESDTNGAYLRENRKVTEREIMENGRDYESVAPPRGLDQFSD